jgi:hypothetical protein
MEEVYEPATLPILGKEESSTSSEPQQPSSEDHSIESLLPSSDKSSIAEKHAHPAPQKARRTSLNQGGESGLLNAELPSPRSKKFLETEARHLSPGALPETSFLSNQASGSAPEGYGSLSAGHSPFGHHSKSAVITEPVYGRTRGGDDDSEGDSMDFHPRKKKRISHCLHCLICLSCFGLWLPCWVGACLGLCCEQPCNRSPNCCGESEEPLFPTV